MALPRARTGGCSRELSWLLDVERCLRTLDDSRNVFAERQLADLLAHVPPKLDRSFSKLVLVLRSAALELQRDPISAGERLDMQGLATHALDLLTRANGYQETRTYESRTAFAPVPIFQLKGAGHD